MDEITVRNCIWFYLLLWLAGLRQENIGREAIWQQAVGGTSELPVQMDSKVARSWPILVFMGIMFSGPYLVWKLISSLGTFHSISRK
jgi:hypothetical protein